MAIFVHLTCAYEHHGSALNDAVHDLEPSVEIGDSYIASPLRRIALRWQMAVSITEPLRKIALLPLSRPFAVGYEPHVN
jgi:hypothetical protein